ncbi:MAG TPA: N-acetylmuramoyl-L-alanine amidase [Bacteroidia bacterium]|jgi:N-acetyl-anhydromuramyl-L-alanine amidase AmpD|nr:N-acetylmuramoyl-L-alanine amidase [Bacteroidia bacterium]
MKKTYLCIVLVSLFFNLLTAQVQKNPYQAFFNKAYIENPSLPKGVLEAVAYTQSRFNHIEPTEYGSCVGLPQAYGVMGLIADGKNYFRSNLVTVSQYSGFSVDDIISSPEKNILAYAKAYSVLLKEAKNSPDKKSFAAHTLVLTQLSELPLDENKVNNFALNSHLYSVYSFLNKPEYQAAYNFPQHRIDMEEIFGRQNLQVLSSSGVTITENEIENQQGVSYKTNNPNSVQSADYAPAIWNPAASCNYTVSRTQSISAVTIHDTEGSYASSIAWFQNCSSQVSAHYVIRSSDGQITQMVLEANKAWHVGSENGYTIGIEHEGYQAQTGWYTTAMYTASAGLVRDICTSGYGINPLRTYNGPSCSGSCVLGSCVKIKGHQHYPNQTHTDPGPNWDWYYYYTLINNAPSITTMTTTSGTFYDSGGPTGNYQNDERTTTLIQPPGATNITLTFTQFRLENGWDYMYVYNGATTSSPLIGRFTGSSLPGTISSGGGSLLLDFRSDCATTDSGWTINYTSNSTGSGGGPDVISPTTQSSVTGLWQTHNFTTTFTDADNVGGSGLEKSYYQASDYNGTEWRANNTHGFFVDNFDVAINPDWTQKTGTWSVSGQALYQSDTILSNTNIYAALDQNLSNRYLYHFIAKIGSIGTNRRAGFHFMCNHPDSTNRGDGYFVWFRVDQSQLQIYKVVNNVFGSPVYTSTVTVNSNQYYDYKVIFDRISGIMRVYQNNVLIGNWTDSSPYSSGSYISFRSGNASLYVDELNVYRSRAASVNVSVGSGNANDIRYQNQNPVTYSGKIKSICSDNAYNLSSVDINNINVDWTPPATIDTVRDGTGADINITNSKTTLSANWNSSNDPNSGIGQYWYCIGTTPGDSNTVAWTSNMVADTVTKTGLHLTQGQFYYFTVRAVDGAGLVSLKTSSNGQKVDTLFGTTAVTQVYGAINSFDIYPNPAHNKINIIYALNQGGPVSIDITDVTGNVVIRETDIKAAGKHEQELDIANLAKGIYFVQVGTSNGKKVLKLVKD